MSLDERGSRAAEGLRASVLDDLAPLDMLASVQRTRARRRLALVAPVAALAVAAAAALTATPRHDQSAPTGPGPAVPSISAPVVPRVNGALFGDGSPALREPVGLVVPPLGWGSSPTWSPDGSHVATLSGGILITDVRSGQTRRLPCVSCSEIAWSPDGRTFAAAGVGGTPLELVDSATGATRPVPLHGIESVTSLSWAPSSDRLTFLVVAPAPLQGAYTVDSDGQGLSEIMLYPTSFENDASGRAVLLELGWAPTRDRIAALMASPVSSAAARTGPYILVVQDIRSDGSGVNLLLRAGRCACVGFAPHLVWSPDGRTLGVSSLHRAQTVSRIDGDGDTVQVRFLRGASGPLSWQPLPGSGP